MGYNGRVLLLDVPEHQDLVEDLCNSSGCTPSAEGKIFLGECRILEERNENILLLVRERSHKFRKLGCTHGIFISTSF